jgi:hypothetical protein
MIETDLRTKIKDYIQSSLPTQFSTVVVQEEITEYKQQGLEISIFLSSTTPDYKETHIERIINYDIAISSTGEDGLGNKSAQTKLEIIVATIKELFLKYWVTLDVARRIKIINIVYAGGDDVDSDEYARICHITLSAEVWENYEQDIN